MSRRCVWRLGSSILDTAALSVDHLMVRRWLPEMSFFA